MTRCSAACTWSYRFRISITLAVAGLVLFLLSLSVVMPQTAPQAALSAGRFLIAGEHLRDPNFVETVVLLLNYGERGARGVIINRPSDVKLAAVFPGISGLHQRPDTVYLGGPVARNQLLILLRSDRPRAGTEHVVDDLYVSTSRQVLVEALNRAAAVHVYAGYAGWAPGQLDREVARGDWHVLPADAAAVFSKTPQEVWRELIDKGAVQWL